MAFEELVNRFVVGVRLNEDKTILQFELLFGRVLTWEAEGDCCSYSWFEHISGVDLINSDGGVVTEIREKLLDPPSADEELGYDCLQNYGWTVVTDRGYFDIEMRNSSNGYYGGWPEFRTYNKEIGKRLTEDV